MTLRRPSRWLKGQPATLDSRLVAEGGPIGGDQGHGMRDTAREIGRRLMPAIVLIGAALLGLAAVAMT